MGLKFKNKTSAGVPVGGNIAERELHLNLKDNEIYSSTDGIDIVKVGSGIEYGGIVWNSTVQYRTGDVVTIDGIVYVIGANPPDVGTPPSEWPEPITIEPERGGIAWRIGQLYEVNDVVGRTNEDGESTPYICVIEHTSSILFNDDINNWINMKFDKSTAMPNPYNLPITHAGDNSFLNISLHSDYKGSTYLSGRCDVLVPGSDGLIYMYQIRTNYIETRMYISTITQDLNTPIYTDTEYKSSWLPEDEYIDYVYNSTPEGMAVRTNNINSPGTKLSYWVNFNNSENPIYHTAKRLDIPVYNGTHNHESFIRIHELNILVYSGVSGQRNKLIVYDYDDFNSILFSEYGINVSSGAGFIELAPTGTGSILYGAGISSLSYDVIGTTLKLKMFGVIMQYTETGYFFADYVDNIEIDTTNYTGFLVPPISPYSYPILMDDENKDEGVDSGLLYYENRHKNKEINIVYIFNTLYRAVSTSTTGGVSAHLITKEGIGEVHGYTGWSDAFDKNFDWEYAKAPKIKSVVLPDSSVIGKGISFSMLVNLKRSDSDPSEETYAITSSAYSKDGIVTGTKAIISGVDVDNLSGYVPTRIEEVQSNLSHIIGLNGTINTVYEDISTYDSDNLKTLHTIKSVDNYEDIKSGITKDILSYEVSDGIVQGWVDDIISADPIMSVSTILNTSNAPIYISNYIPSTEYAIFSCSIIFLADGDTYRSSKLFYSIVNLSTYSLLLTPIEYAYSENSASIDDVSTIYGNVNSKKICSWVSGTDVYIWSLLAGIDTNSANPYPRSLRMIIDSTTGTINDVKIFDANSSIGSDAREQTFALCVHPDVGFFSSYTQGNNYLAADLRGLNPGTSTPVLDSWSYELSESDGIFLTIRSSNELEITFDEFPVMLNGYYRIVKQHTFKEPIIIKNSKQYIYMIVDTDGELTYEFTFEETESTLTRIYIGWILTDDISVVESYTQKDFILGGFVFTSDSNIKPIVRDGTDIGMSDSLFRNGFFNGIVLKDTITSELYRLTVENGSIVATFYA